MKKNPFHPFIFEINFHTMLRSCYIHLFRRSTNKRKDAFTLNLLFFFFLCLRHNLCEYSNSLECHHSSGMRESISTLDNDEILSFELNRCMIFWFWNKLSRKNKSLKVLKHFWIHLEFLLENLYFFVMSNRKQSNFCKAIIHSELCLT